jgi:hypothetical protein
MNLFFLEQAPKRVKKLRDKGEFPLLQSLLPDRIKYHLSIENYYSWENLELAMLHCTQETFEQAFPYLYAKIQIQDGIAMTGISEIDMMEQALARGEDLSDYLATYNQ